MIITELFVVKQMKKIWRLSYTEKTRTEQTVLSEIWRKTEPSSSVTHTIKKPNHTSEKLNISHLCKTCIKTSPLLVQVLCFFICVLKKGPWVFRSGRALLEMRDLLRNSDFLFSTQGLMCDLQRIFSEVMNPFRFVKTLENRWFTFYTLETFQHLSNTLLNSCLINCW